MITIYSLFLKDNGRNATKYLVISSGYQKIKNLHKEEISVYIHCITETPTISQCKKRGGGEEVL